MKYKKYIKSLISIIYPKHLFLGKKTVKAPILCYHSVNDSRNDECDPINKSRFEAHLKYLVNNYTVLPLSVMVNLLRAGSPIPSNAVVITFDDGYRDNFEVVLPLLEKYRCHATFFVVTDFIDELVELNGEIGFEAMSWDQVKELDKSPYAEIGCHGKTHTILSLLNEEELGKEILQSKFSLEEKLKRKVDLFAFPNGQGADIHYGSLDLLKSYGFKASCSTFWRTYQSPNTHYLLNRVMIYGDDDQIDLQNKLEGDFDFLYFIHKCSALFSVIKGGRGIW